MGTSIVGSTSSTWGQGLYSVSVTDPKGCFASSSISVQAPSGIFILLSSFKTLITCYIIAIDVRYTALATTCSYTSDGRLTLSALGGTSPFTFWVFYSL